jgi:hypothetical protein
VCADCESLEGVVVVPTREGAPEDSGVGVPDYCPGCGDYLSLVSMGEVEVEGVALYHLRGRSFGGGRVEP